MVGVAEGRVDGEQRGLVAGVAVLFTGGGCHGEEEVEEEGACRVRGAHGARSIRWTAYLEGQHVRVYIHIHT